MGSQIGKKDIASLNVLPTDYTPKATEHIKDMIAMIEKLLSIGYAYITPLAVYFDTSKVADYTKLSGQKIENNIVGTGHGTVSDKDKKNPSDFGLWLFKTGAQAGALQTWNSPFETTSVDNGLGFPGWHIECSAMSKHFLGENFDIHMGGIEHIPVHHTNEIAQSESANDVPYAQYWLHNEHLTVDGGKMSKSEGTSITMHDIIERGYNPLSLRFFFLQAHYRSQQNFTWHALEAAQTAYMRVLNFVQSVATTGVPSEKYITLFKEALSDDINTSSALSVVFEVLKDTDLEDTDKKATLVDFDKVLGLSLDTQKVIRDIPKEITDLAEARAEAKRENDWEKADALRQQILDKGYTVTDTKTGFQLE